VQEAIAFVLLAQSPAAQQPPVLKFVQAPPPQSVNPEAQVYEQVLLEVQVAVALLCGVQSLLVQQPLTATQVPFPQLLNVLLQVYVQAFEALQNGVAPATGGQSLLVQQSPLAMHAVLLQFLNPVPQA
jgi:hypothetical protein